MKMIRKIATVALGLACIGSSVFAQSLADAKKAIDAEQYQKAKTMLKNLTVTQAKDDETFFQLGWVYLLQDYIDSAKTVFNQGITNHPKSALNYVGLGVAARLNKDNAGATSNFNTAMGFTGKKDSKPWLYMGRGYLMLLPNTKAITNADANAAKAALEKGKLANPKDAEVALELGNAFRSQRETAQAYENYNDALRLDPKMPAVKVALGVLYSNARNFEDGIKEYQDALKIDPNYGPAYREWAETDLNSSFENKATASAKIKEGLEQYKKYMSLTDESDETLMRYADFLINAGEYAELQQVAAKLSKSAGANVRVWRYLGYAAYENKKYQQGIEAMNNWFSKAGPTRILPRDYMYQGRLKIASGQDTTEGVNTIKKAVEQDSTLAESGLKDILDVHKKRNDYLGQASTYEEMTRRIRNRSTFSEGVLGGIYYYFAFSRTKDSTLLVKADTLLTRAIKVATTPELNALIYKARIEGLRDSRDPEKMVGKAKPYYEQFIAAFTAKPSTVASMIKNLGEAYGYMGNYYLYHDKDATKAEEMYTKALEKDPANDQAKYYFDNKNKPAAAPAPKKATK